VLRRPPRPRLLSLRTTIPSIGSFGISQSATKRCRLRGIHEDSSELALRFGDKTYDEIKTKASAGAGNCPADLLSEMNDVFRHKFHYNISGRLLADVLSPEPGGYFAAMIKGEKYARKSCTSSTRTGSIFSTVA